MPVFSYDALAKEQWRVLTANGQIATLGPPHARLTVTPVIDTAIHTAGDCLGPLQTLTGASRYPGGGGIIRSIQVFDNTQAQRAAMDILLFSDTVTTAATNAPFAASDADMQKLVALIPVIAADYNTAWPGTPNNSVAYKPNVGVAANPQSMSIPYWCGSTTSLFMQLVVRGTPTYVASTDITVAFDVVQD